MDSEELDARIAALERDLEHGAGLLTKRGVEILRRRLRGAAAGALGRGDASGRRAHSGGQARDGRAEERRRGCVARSAGAGPTVMTLPCGACLASGGRTQEGRRHGRGQRGCGARPASANVATCSYSSAVTRTLVAAARFGPPGSVVVYEPCTRPDTPGTPSGRRNRGRGLARVRSCRTGLRSRRARRSGAGRRGRGDGGRGRERRADRRARRRGGGPRFPSTWCARRSSSPTTPRPRRGTTAFRWNRSRT